ncbi:MAG: signal peptide peptidase SppA [Spartobacteria bacterium]|nr:signal peptide peptidase SppA [Spartobacteria bacterium]
MTENKQIAHVVYWILIVIMGGMLALSMLINGLVVIGVALSGVGQPVVEQAEDEFPQLTERWSYGEGEYKAARIFLQGVIVREAPGGFLTPDFDPVERILQQIRAAENDEYVKAIILEVDSPGGAITPSDEIYRALLAFRETDPDRRIIVFMRDVAASGGYLVSMAGDWLIAEPTSLIGSIGVIMQTLNWKTLSEKVGVVDVTFKSGATKDVLNPFRDVTEEEERMMQAVIDNLYQYFFAIVMQGRDIDAATLSPLADGSIFTAEMALRHRLIDDIGYWDAVMEKTRGLTGLDTIKIVRYEQEKGFFEMLAQASSPLDPRSWLMSRPPRMMYLWNP